MFSTVPHRSRARLGLGAAALAALALPSATLAQAPDRIDLPSGWQPEGITTDGTALYAGSLADGAIWKGDPVSGTGDVLVPGAEGMISVGLDIDTDNGRLFAAGGPTGEVRAYDSTSGELLQTYPFEAGFINDVAVTPEAVYFTDSFMPQVLVVPLGDDGSLAAPEDAYVLPIGGELEYGEGFNLNGIVATDAGLVAVHSPTGVLYHIDPDTGESTAVDSGDVTLTNGDGLELVDGTLYVVRNRDNTVAVLELSEDAATASAVGDLTSDDLAVPTTAARIGDDLWAVNARFGVETSADTAYWITRLDAAATSDG